jgi:hypothetical protein
MVGVPIAMPPSLRRGSIIPEDKSNLHPSAMHVPRITWFATRSYIVLHYNVKCLDIQKGEGLLLNQIRAEAEPCLGSRSLGYIVLAGKDEYCLLKLPYFSKALERVI